MMKMMENNNLLYSKRKQLSDLIVDWMDKNDLGISIFNTISALDSNGLLNVEKIKEYIKDKNSGD